MIFPRKKEVQAASAAWWQPPTAPKSSKGSAVLIAVLAGSIGGVLGVNAGGGDLFNRVQLVSSTSTIQRAPDSVAGIAQRVLPSVVSISTRSISGAGTGSGFVIDSSGYILTNNHVISKAAQTGGSIQVSLSDGTFYSAKVIGRDASYDLAVLKINASGLKALQFGDSDAVAVGDLVIAIGSPLGLSGTVTTGIISAKNRAVTAGESDSESSFINALQTDAAINPGNSGGPLVNSRGEVIGVNSAIATTGSSVSGQSGSIGLGFAIPVNQARRVATELIATGKSTYPIIGVQLDLNYNESGALVESIVPDGPASQTELQAGDVIVAIDGVKVSNGTELVVRIRAKNPGDVVELELSDGSVVKVTLGSDQS